VDINIAWETVRGNVKISAKENLLVLNWRTINHSSTKDAQNCWIKGNQAKLEWLQDEGEINGNNLNNTQCEANRNFRNKNLDIRKRILKSLQWTVRTRILEICWEKKESCSCA
jgi:hypothetical protein